MVGNPGICIGFHRERAVGRPDRIGFPAHSGSGQEPEAIAVGEVRVHDQIVLKQQQSVQFGHAGAKDAVQSMGMPFGRSWGPAETQGGGGHPAEELPPAPSGVWLIYDPDMAAHGHPPADVV
jgi:hypothetical protein